MTDEPLSSDMLYSPFRLNSAQVEMASLAEGVGLDFAQCLCQRALKGQSQRRSNAHISNLSLRIGRFFSNLEQLLDCSQLARRRFCDAREAEGALQYRGAVLTQADAVWPEDVGIWEFHEAVGYQKGRCLCGEHVILGSPIPPDSPIHARCYEEAIAIVAGVKKRAKELMHIYNRPNPSGDDEDKTPWPSPSPASTSVRSPSRTYVTTTSLLSSSALSSPASAFAFARALGRQAARALRHAPNERVIQLKDLPRLLREAMTSAQRSGSGSSSSSSDTEHGKRSGNGHTPFAGSGGVGGSIAELLGGSGAIAAGGGRFVLRRGRP